ncbi:hypothetical protein MCOR34_006811 [Pyricularia oryzae]|nr:hypothetical protein MCOR34_006811 [Pyricularia oryzae]KAI6500871.1 hypothetical protein MCOR13_005813 [Pyricularia oryzae]
MEATKEDLEQQRLLPDCEDQKAPIENEATHSSSSRQRRPPLVPLLLVIGIFSLLLLPTRTTVGCHKLPAAAVSTYNSTASPPDHSKSSVSLVPDIWAQNTVPKGKESPSSSSHMGRVISAIRNAASNALHKRQLGIPGLPGIPGLTTPRRSVLQCFEVSQPVLTPANSTRAGGAPCSALLMEHVFAFSYGKPFVGNYTPPNCDFNRVVMNFSVVSAGRQFDRLALMYLGDTEVWRTSTAEPTASPGIHWEYHRDMTQYLSLWKKPQTVIFDLGNLVNANYTASFNTTLTATFFKDDVKTATAPPADVIIPITALNYSRNEGTPLSVFLLPGMNASTTVKSFPRNANRAVLAIQANGQAAEEFWWSNLLQSDVATFNATNGMAPGMSPFREVAAMIDGKLAGFQWPFPVIFTGGVVPTLHRPVVGLQAFNFREHEIDITPWLPLLCDGNPHTFSFDVRGLLDDNGKSGTLSNNITSSWYITGKVFVWLDDEGSITTGSTPEIQGVDPSIDISQHAITRDQRGRNQTLTYNVAVKRDFTVKARVKTQKSSFESAWRQRLSYDNKNNVTNYGQDQVTRFGVLGSDTAFSDQKTIYGQDYNYPLAVDMRIQNSPQTGTMTLSAGMNQGMTFQIAGRSVFPDGLEAFAGTRNDKNFSASILSTFREGSATFQQTIIPGRPSTSTGSGNIRQEFSFGGNFERYPEIFNATAGIGSQPDVMLYYRNLTVANNAVTRDRETIAGRRNNEVSSATATAPSVDRNVVSEPAPDQVYFDAASSRDDFAAPRFPTAAKFGVGYGPFMEKRWQ